LFIVEIQKFTENKISNYHSIYNMSGVFSLGLSLIRFNISLHRFQKCWNNLGILVFNFYRCGAHEGESNHHCPLKWCQCGIEVKMNCGFTSPLGSFCDGKPLVSHCENPRKIPSFPRIKLFITPLFLEMIIKILVVLQKCFTRCVLVSLI